MVAKLALNDIIKLKKPHPCGTNEWKVDKLGMDIGLTCLGCGHHVKIRRSKLNKNLRGLIENTSDQNHI
ncbi:MAG TPA: DUF951 domain-containing protein [Actinobacteria bacterium]|nr:DUF951 domain-containing protein [Actinomycetota bacterium]